jgi:hypothetical protein
MGVVGGIIEGGDGIGVMLLCTREEPARDDQCKCSVGVSVGVSARKCTCNMHHLPRARG